jgi:hypothetical protein
MSQRPAASRRPWTMRNGTPRPLNLITITHHVRFGRHPKDRRYPMDINRPIAVERAIVVDWRPRGANILVCQ